MNSSEPNPAWVSFCTEAARLARLGNERLLAALPVFTVIGSGEFVIRDGKVLPAEGQ